MEGQSVDLSIEVTDSQLADLRRLAREHTGGADDGAVGEVVARALEQWADELLIMGEEPEDEKDQEPVATWSVAKDEDAQGVSDSVRAWLFRRSS